MALDRAGRKLFHKTLPHDQTRLREILTGLAGHGRILVVVDQPATNGALPAAVAQATGAPVGYLPGLAMCRIADLHPGQARTETKDAPVIADAARSMPHTLQNIALDDLTPAELGVLCGFDDDRAAERLTGAVFAALREQTVVVVGTSAAGIVLPELAEQLLSLRHQGTPSPPGSKPSSRPTLFIRS